MVNALVLDAGALIALDRGDRRIWAGLARADQSGSVIATPTSVVAQAWRDGPRHARLARALHLTDEISLDSVMARLAGSLCGRAGTSDVVDASVALLAGSFGQGSTVTVATSDGDDIERLLGHLDVDHVRIAPV